MILEALLHKGPLTITEIRGQILLAGGSMTAAAHPSGPPRSSIGAHLRRTALAERMHRNHMADFESLLEIPGDEENHQTYANLKKLGLHEAAK